MNEPGVATLWVRTPEGENVDVLAPVSRPEGEQQVLVVQVQTEGLSMNLVFRRADFSRWLAKPNNPDEAIEVAVNLEEE